jgi:hypothetical protein
LILKAMLGGEHDWVVGTANQGILAPHTILTGYTPTPYSSWHTTYYDLAKVRDRVQDFLIQGQ